MGHFNKAPCAVIVLLAVACGVNSSDDKKKDGGELAHSGINVQIMADKSPALMGTATLSCIYEVNYNIRPIGRDDYIASGHFVLPSTHFEVVSGESAWIDTVQANETRHHQVVVRALVRGDWLVDALVSSVIEESVSTIGGGDSIELHVK